MYKIRKSLILISILISICIISGCNKDNTKQPDKSIEATETNTKTTEPEETTEPTATPEPTQAPKPTVDVNAPAPAADFIDLLFNTDGSVSNKVKDSVAITTKGVIKVNEDTEIGMNAAQFPGGSNYYRADLADYYDQLEEGFSLEIFAKFTALPESGYWGVIDNCEAGGFGLELHPLSDTTGNLKFSMHLDGAYSEINAEASLDTWYHIVMTWDGSVMSIYVDGKLVEEYDSEYGYLQFTSVTNAQYLAMGACCAAPTGGQGFKGSMGICRVYFKGLNLSEVSKLNTAARKR